RAAATPLVHGVDQEAEADAFEMIRQEVVGELARKRHQVVVGNRAGDDDFHRRPFRCGDRAGMPIYLKYLPMMGRSSCLVASGTSSARVMIAVARASLQPHVLGIVNRETASAIAFCAVDAFCSRLATMRSTVTES